MVQQRLGVTDITIRYHRPLVDGRKIWGALVPYDKVWRAGANFNTTIEVSDPVSVEGKPLPRGTYGLHMIPTADAWTIIFSKAADSWGSYTYDQAEDALRVTVKPRPGEMQEALQYSFEDLKADSATVTMSWEKLAVPFRIAVNDKETVLPYIRRKMRGFQQYFWGPPNEAAQYCLEKKIALPEALKWADLSIQAEERFENLAHQSRHPQSDGQNRRGQENLATRHGTRQTRPALHLRPRPPGAEARRRSDGDLQDRRGAKP